MDLETRLVWCMVTLQGYTEADAKKGPFGGPDRKSDMEALRRLRHVRVARREDERVARRIRRSRKPIALGEKIFYFRGGTHDFACATCHGEDGKRIRLQDLPNLTKPDGRAEGLHDVARVPRVAGRAAHVPVAAERLLPPAALPRARVRVRRVDRADDVPRPQCQRRRVRRAGDQALTEATPCNADMLSLCACRASRAAVILVGCATAPCDAEITAKAAAVLKASFQERGQAKLDRLDQDDTQKTCSEYAGKALPKDVAERIEKANLASIKWPADGKYLGDWKNGEKIAQEGRGMQYSDDPEGPGRRQLLRVPPARAAGALVRHDRPVALPVRQGARLHATTTRKYAYGKIYNAEAYSACTNMPRFGHNGILTEQQIKDVVALLMDPESPVNK